MIKTPETAVKINESIKKPVKTVIFTPKKALGLLLSLKLSKWQYITLRETAIREGERIFTHPTINCNKLSLHATLLINQCQLRIHQLELHFKLYLTSR